MSSDLKVTNIKHESSSSNNLVLGSDGNVSITNTLSAGTIGDNVTMSNKYWRTASVNTSTSINSGANTINTSTQTDPYFAAGYGDTTNLPYSDGNLIKVVRAGIYLVNFSPTFLYPSTDSSRAVKAEIFYGTTTSVSSVAGA